MSDNVEPCVLINTIATTNGYRLGVATLNSPKYLNSLTIDMVDILTPQLQAWQNDDSIACVLLRGSGDRAFCAGGDVVALSESAKANDGVAAHFFAEEYRLDYLIHTYSKPIIVWGHGVVMGGGLGLFSGASHRVVTPKTRLAMPEVTIGLFPDVGGSWFLNRTPGRTGLFLALTGAAINATDTLYLGLADRFLDNEQWDDVVSGLSTANWPQDSSSHHGQVSQVLRMLEANAPELPTSVIEDHYATIQTMTDGDSFADIFANITHYQGDDKWLSSAARTLATGCPLSIHVIYQQLKACLHLSLKEVFQQELIVAANCMDHNFAEGVRALLIDKDRQPKFDPPTFDTVTASHIAQRFQAPWDTNPLADL